MGALAEQDSQLYIEHNDGTVETGDPLGIYARLRTAKSWIEYERGLAAQAERDAAEIRRRRQLAPEPPPPLPPPAAEVSPPPVTQRPAGDDSPRQQGARDVVATAVVKPQEAAPVVSRTEPSHSAWQQFRPIAIAEVAGLIEPPPATAEEARALERRVAANEPEPGEADPVHAAPAVRHPAATGDPVELFTGAFTISAMDLAVPTAHLPIAMKRTYRSGRASLGPFGFGWDHAYNVYLRPLNDGAMALRSGALCEQRFSPGGGGWEPEPGLAARLQQAAGGADSLEVVFPGGLRWTFDRPVGWSDVARIPLAAITDRHGNVIRLSYDSEDRVASVLDDAARGLWFGYGDCGLLEQVSDHTHTRVVRYDHDPEIEQLVSVTLPATRQYPQGLVARYDYDRDAEHPAMRHNIVRVFDADGRLVLENEYGDPDAGWSFNSVVRQRAAGFEHGFCYEPIQHVWPDPSNVGLAATRTMVRTPDGGLHTYTFNYRGDLLDRRFRLNRDGSFRVVATQYEHDAEGNLTATIGPDGLREIRTYDGTSADPCARHNLLLVELAAPLSGIVTSRIVFEATYEPRFQLPTTVRDERGSETRLVYDADSNPAKPAGRLSRIELPPVVRPDQTSQQTVLAFAVGKSGHLEAVTAGEGGRTELEYVKSGIHQGFLASVTQHLPASPLRTAFGYDAAGFPSEVQAPGGRRTGVSYDALGQLETVSAPAVADATSDVRCSYDDTGGVVRIERPVGAALGALTDGTAIVDTYERDETGAVRRITAAANTASPRIERHSVDYAGRPVSSWDPSGTRTDRVYGENGALLSETVAAGEPGAERTTFGYDIAGRQTRVTGPGGEVSTISHDMWGRVRRFSLPAGGQRSLRWGVCDCLLETTTEDRPTGGAAGRPLQRESREYDARGRLVAVTQWSFDDEAAAATPIRTAWLRDRDDRVRTVLLPRGARRQFDHDAMGRLTGLTDVDGNRRELAYDAFGDLASVTDTWLEDDGPHSRTRTFTYDPRGRLARTDCLGAFATRSYDDRDVAIETREPSGVVHRSVVDVHNEVIETLVDPGGLALRSQFEHDANGRLRRYVDPTGQASTWDRDALGQVTAFSVPGGAVWRCIADARARTTEQRAPSGSRVVITRPVDGDDPLTMTAAAALGQEPVAAHRLFRDGLGRVVRADVGANAVVRRYDSLDRVTEENTGGRTVRREYDDAAGLVELVFPDGRRERTEHDLAGRPTRVVLLAPGALAGVAGDVLLELFYDPSGRLARMRYGNGVVGRLAYDDHERLVRVDYHDSGKLVDSCRVRYDDAGHRAVVQSLGAPARNAWHRFDGRGRLIEARWGFGLAPLTDPAPGSEAADLTAIRNAAAGAPGARFELDGADTRTGVVGINGGVATETWTSAPDHRVTHAGAQAFGYSLDGQRTLDARYHYELDALGRVRRVLDRTTNAVVAELQYDALSRVVAGSTNGQPFDRWYDGAMPIEEVSGPPPGAARQHSHHPVWGSPFAVVDVAGPAYVHQDDALSTLCVTDASGAVLERHRHDAFGVHTAFSGDGVTPVPALRTEPRWRGMPALSGSRLLQSSVRLYDPATGVFESRDPLLYTDSPSPFSFAGHNPADYADPTGLGKASLGAATEPRTGISKWLYEDSKQAWTQPAERGDVLQLNRAVDTGSIIENYAVNTWITATNVLASLINMPFGMLNKLDEVMLSSPIRSEWQQIQMTVPLMRTMGLAIETAGTLTYLSGLLRSSRVAALSKSVALSSAGMGLGGVLLPGKRLRAADIPILTSVSPQEALEGMHATIVSRFTLRPHLVGDYLKAGELRALSDAQAYARMGDWSDLTAQAPTLFGKAVERAIVSSTEGSRLLAPTGQMRSPLGRFLSAPDFRGLGPLNGLFVESTTNAAHYAHTLRGYPASTIYLTYDIPLSWYLFLTP